MNRTLKLLSLVLLLGCGRSTPLDVYVVFGSPPDPQPADPPYTSILVLPSGLRLSLVSDATLSQTYPSPSNNPFGGTRLGHYQAVGFFIPIDRVSLSNRVSENFVLSEYVNPTMQRGGTFAYIDAQTAHHVQMIRSGLGRPVSLLSAFRSPEHNAAIGGASYSRHQYGDAVDIDVNQSLSDANIVGQEVFNEAVDVGVDFVLPLLETSVDVGGEMRASWVHLDNRGF